MGWDDLNDLDEKAKVGPWEVLMSATERASPKNKSIKYYDMTITFGRSVMEELSWVKNTPVKIIWGTDCSYW
jgi:hypothetical protein